MLISNKTQSKSIKPKITQKTPVGWVLLKNTGVFGALGTGHSTLMLEQKQEQFLSLH